MNLTRTSYIRLLRLILAILIILIIVAYAIWRSLNYARGPAITITSPQNGTSINSETVEITGHADRANNLIMNGQSISVDQQGNFDETVIVFPGTNKITFVANDQFGRKISKELDLVGAIEFKTLSTSSNAATASSTASTTKTQ